MKIALPYVFQGKNSGQGVFEETFARSLKSCGCQVKTLYPSNLELRKVKEMGVVLTMTSLYEHYQKIKNFDIIYSTNGTSIAFLKNSSNIPVIPTYHSHGPAIYSDFFLNKHALIEKEIYLSYQNELSPLELVDEDIRSKTMEAWSICGKYMAKNAKHIIAVSKKVKDELILHSGAGSKNISVIHNGLESFWFEDNHCQKCQSEIERKVDPNKTSILWIGRMGREKMSFQLKGIDRLIKIFDSLDDKKFNKIVVAIIPSEKHEYLNLYRRFFKRHNVILFENWHYEHLPHIMKYADIFLLTSRYEGFSLSLIEAMACSLPTISYPVGVAPEIIHNHTNGYLIKNLEEMTEKIYFLQNNNDIAKQIGEKAHNTVKNKCLLKNMTNKYISLYKKVIS